jgi:hypothetical protein
MTVKFSQLPLRSSVSGAIQVVILDPVGPSNYLTTVDAVTNYVLSGNAATATKLQTARTINGVAFDGTQNISITTSVPDASTSTKGLVLIPTVGTSGITNTSGTITVAVASSTQRGAVKIGAGINVSVDGTISAATKLFHGFSVDSTGNLIYSTTTDTPINLQDQYGADLYEDTDIGTNEYSYSMDSDGNLIVTFN